MNDYLKSIAKQDSTGEISYSVEGQETAISPGDDDKKYNDDSKLFEGTTDLDVEARLNPSMVKIRKLRLYKQQWIKK